MFGLWGGNGSGVTVSISTDAAWERSGRYTVVGDPDTQKRATDTLDGFSNCGGPTGMPS